MKSPGSPDKRRSPATKSRRRPALLAVLAGVLVVCAVVALRARGGLHADWRGLARQMRFASPAVAALGLLAIGVGYCLRAVRWGVLMRLPPVQAWRRLLPAQLIGFTAVALVGRAADLVRPYLTARDTETPVSTQLAVYSLERGLDLAAAAVLFSVTLLFAPASLPHSTALARAGVLAVAATAALLGFAVLIRQFGDSLALALARTLRRFSPRVAAAATYRIGEFRKGLLLVQSTGQLVSAFVLSLLMWILIALTYLAAARAFRGSLVLAGFSFTQVVLLMAVSLGASLLQLPVLGWFTQMAALAATLHAVFGVPLEVASACAALAFFLTTLSVIPAGLIVARIRGIGIRGVVAAQSSPEVI